MNNLLEVNGVKTYFHTFKGTVKAVDDVSFNLKQEEILGIVGESGGGKSVLGFSILRLIESPGKIEAGEIIFEGKNLLNLREGQMQEVRGNSISMIFQDPMTSLNPLYTIGDQIEETLRLHQKELSETQRKNKVIELLKSVGIPDPENRVNDYPHQFSGGMRQRVIIAIALATQPKLIIADEPTTALDVTVQAQIVKLLVELVEKNRSSLIFITHDLSLVSQIADRILVMYCGKMVECAPVKDIIENPAHPYTQGLIASIPSFGIEKDRLAQIPGAVPSPFALPKGCKFAPRCYAKRPLCDEEEPKLVQIGKEHEVCCHFPQGGRFNEPSSGRS